VINDSDSKTNSSGQDGGASGSPVPPRPRNSFRIELVLKYPERRLDNVLLAAMRAQTRSLEIKTLSRAKLKLLFDAKRVRIKGQAATPSSSLAVGTTYVDLIGFEDPSEKKL